MARRWSAQSALTVPQALRPHSRRRLRRPQPVSPSTRLVASLVRDREKEARVEFGEVRAADLAKNQIDLVAQDTDRFADAWNTCRGSAVKRRATDEDEARAVA